MVHRENTDLARPRRALSSRAPQLVRRRRGTTPSAAQRATRRRRRKTTFSLNMGRGKAAFAACRVTDCLLTLRGRKHTFLCEDQLMSFGSSRNFYNQLESVVLNERMGWGNLFYFRRFSKAQLRVPFKKGRPDSTPPGSCSRKGGLIDETRTSV